jgi:hypothetical protein
VGMKLADSTILDRQTIRGLGLPTREMNRLLLYYIDHAVGELREHLNHPYIPIPGCGEVGRTRILAAIDGEPVLASAEDLERAIRRIKREAQAKIDRLRRRAARHIGAMEWRP